MTIRVLGGAAVLVLASCASGGSAGSVESSPGVEGANTVLPWAFVVNDPAPEGAVEREPNELVTVPGSPVSIRRSEISLSNGPPDWHPNGHPAMPQVVASGGGDGVAACGYCHLPNGQGKPENAGLAGQPFAYLIQQMQDYRNGLRRTGEPRMGPPALMMRIGTAATEQQARIAAAYFSSIDFKPWIRVVETELVPVTRFAGSIHHVVKGGGMEPIGLRVVEIPEDLRRTELRDDASGFIAYVPLGTVQRGTSLVNEGGRWSYGGVHHMPRSRSPRRRPHAGTGRSLSQLYGATALRPPAGKSGRRLVRSDGPRRSKPHRSGYRRHRGLPREPGPLGRETG